MIMSRSLDEEREVIRHLEEQYALKDDLKKFEESASSLSQKEREEALSALMVRLEENSKKTYAMVGLEYKPLPDILTKFIS